MTTIFVVFYFLGENAGYCGTNTFCTAALPEGGRGSVQYLASAGRQASIKMLVCRALQNGFASY